MELVLDEAQTILRESADKLIERHAGPGRFRELRTTEHGFDRARLVEVAEAGWLSLLVPEERDGLGLGTTEAALVLEAAGRGLMTEPVAAVMAAARAVAAGPAAMNATLEALVAGRAVIVPALSDPAAEDPDGARIQAVAAGDGFTLGGRTDAVPGAAAADGFIVGARSGDGTVVCLVPRDAPGLEVAQRARVDGTGHAALALTDVPVPADGVVASGAQGTELAAATLDLVLLGTSAEMLGIMEQGLTLAVDYLGTREQFGRLIGSFQALQHRAVNDHIDIELTRSLLYQVCAAMDEGRGNRAMVAAVKARASDAVLSVTKSMVQMHGAIGFTDEYDASLYLRRAMSLSAEYGNADSHRKRYARLSSRAA
ncbi:MAG: acyl-CoA/acyl-ACP dehydrogenase [Deltaproteobacteria bacterium]|nr:acyl-CoA/acyl-ACP dehydrogenase [Deltaproteobacteria bacterium]